MELNYRKIGSFITKVSEKNKEGLYDEVLGVAIEKEFMPSVANTIGTDLKKYNVVRKGRFAFNPMHVGRDEKLPIAVYHKDEPALVSPAYFMFEVCDKDVDIDYLMLIFKTASFDHLCWFHTDASVRGGLTWEDFTEIEVNIPSLDIQQKVVNQYRTITDRIGVLEKINAELTNFIVKYNGYFIKEHNKGEEPGSLEQLCENIYSGGTPSTSEEEYWNGDLLWLSSGETSESYVVTTEKTITSKGVKNSSTKLAEKGSIVIASAGQGKTRGQTSYLLKDMYVNQSVIVLKPQKNCGAYIFSNLKGRYDELRTGSDLNAIRGSLTTTEVKAFPIYIPTQNEMQEYNKKIQPILDCIDAQIKEIYELFLMKESFIEKHI